MKPDKLFMKSLKPGFLAGAVMYVISLIIGKIQGFSVVFSTIDVRAQAEAGGAQVPAITGYIHSSNQ